MDSAETLENAVLMIEFRRAPDENDDQFRRSVHQLCDTLHADNTKTVWAERRADVRYAEWPTFLNLAALVFPQE